MKALRDGLSWLLAGILWLIAFILSMVMLIRLIPHVNTAWDWIAQVRIVDWVIYY